MVILKRISSGQLTATHFHAAGAAEGMQTHFPDCTGGIRDLRRHCGRQVCQSGSLRLRGRDFGIGLSPSFWSKFSSLRSGGRMPLARARFIRLMQQYSEMAYRLTLLEIQKLAYFLQEAGEPLKLNYVAHTYGPYAHNLNKLLETLEGHFTTGYGDSQKPDVEVELLPGAIEKADQLLAKNEISKERLQRVASLIEGIETPYGMELLASTHWVSVHGNPPAINAEKAVEEVHHWNDRKRKMFKPEHIQIAWNRLHEQDWLNR